MGFFTRREPEPGAGPSPTFGSVVAAGGALGDLSSQDAALFKNSRVARLVPLPAHESLLGIAPGCIVKPLKSLPGVLVTTSHRMFFMPNEEGGGFVAFYPNCLTGADMNLDDEKRLVLDLAFDPDGEWTADEPMKQALVHSGHPQVTMLIGTGTTPPSTFLKPVQIYVGTSA
jgi:hypothetical protein